MGLIERTRRVWSSDGSGWTDIVALPCFCFGIVSALELYEFPLSLTCSCEARLFVVSQYVSYMCCLRNDAAVVYINRSIEINI
jgi:hypothetical protein